MLRPDAGVPVAAAVSWWRTPAVQVGALLAGITAILYGATLSPTFTWGDSADLPLRVFDRSDRLFDLTPREYLLYRAIGRLFLQVPLGDVAYRVNLMTACFGVLAVVAVYATVVLRTRKVGAAALAALALAVSHTFWLLAVTAEVYTFATFLGVTLLLLALAWREGGHVGWFMGAALVLGLGVAHHLAAALCLPGVALLLLLERRRWPGPRAWTAALVLFAVGALPLETELVRIGMLQGVRGIAGFFAGSGLSPTPVHDAVFALAFLGYQFPGPALLLGVAGAWIVVRRRDAWDLMLLATLVLWSGWSVLSRVPDKHNVYVFVYPLFAILVGIGAEPALAWLEAHMRRRRRAGIALAGAVAALPVFTYLAAPLLASRFHVDLVHARPCPNRDNTWFFLCPPKNGCDGARRYAESALDAVPPSACIVADYSLWRPLCFLQRVEGRRRDVEVTFVEPLLPRGRILEFLRGSVARRPTYLATNAPAEYYRLDLVQPRFRLEPEGPVFRVVAR